MSLISPRHLLTPFTNLVHITSILLLTAVFVVLRWSGGALEVIPDSSPEAPRFSTGALASQPAARRWVAEESEEPAADKHELMQKLTGKEQKEPPANPGNNSLEDIEKSLGLK